MGQNLILNMDDNGFVVCAYNRTVDKVGMTAHSSNLDRLLIDLLRGDVTSITCNFALLASLIPLNLDRRTY